MRWKSGFTGVFLLHGRWRAHLYDKGENVHLGDYDTPEEAARRVDEEVLARDVPQALNFQPELS